MDFPTTKLQWEFLMIVIAEKKRSFEIKLLFEEMNHIDQITKLEQFYLMKAEMH